MSSAVRRTWRRLVRSYIALCARDDAAEYGVTIPSGIWACANCHQGHLELASLQYHLRTEHPGATAG